MFFVLFAFLLQALLNGCANYRNIDKLLYSETEHLRTLERDLAAETQKLRSASELLTAMEQVLGGTFVQALVAEEQKRREISFLQEIIT